MRRLFVALCVLFCCAVAEGAGTAMVTVVSDPFPPFVDDKRPSQGLSLEIIREAFATQGYEVKLEELVPWARAIGAVREGYTDILPAAWMTTERKNTLLFSDPYAMNNLKFIKRKGDPFEFEGIESLSGKTVGVIRSCEYCDALVSATNFVREEGTDFVMNVRKLVGGRCDLTVEDEIVATVQLRQEAPALFEQIEFTKNALSSTPLHIACGLRNPRCHEIIDAFNKGLAAIRANGKYDEILKSYGLK